MARHGVEMGRGWRCGVVVPEQPSVCGRAGTYVVAGVVALVGKRCRLTDDATCSEVYFGT
jgi:hypothetical protein